MPHPNSRRATREKAKSAARELRGIPNEPSDTTMEVYRRRWVQELHSAPNSRRRSRLRKLLAMDLSEFWAWKTDHATPPHLREVDDPPDYFNYAVGYARMYGGGYGTYQSDDTYSEEGW